MATLEDTEDVKVIRFRWQFGAAFTLPWRGRKLVFVKDRLRSDQVRHELEHVRQIDRWGARRYIWRVGICRTIWSIVHHRNLYGVLHYTEWPAYQAQYPMLTPDGLRKLLDEDGLL